VPYSAFGSGNTHQPLQAGSEPSREQVSPSKYAAFIKAVAGVVKAHGKTLFGWCEISNTDAGVGSISQHWFTECPNAAGVARGMDILLTPAVSAYLDMKYTADSPIGGNWAGYIDVKKAYEMATELNGVPPERVVGIEAALWTEFVKTRADIDYLMFPRLCGHAEVGWSSPNRTFADYAKRMPQHGERLSAAGVAFFHAPEIAWQ
jgi:hexosaminidase